MSTPICDFVKNYIQNNPTRLHMPGHKGRAVPRELAEITQLDITEISGADSLFEASGIIAESEKIMSELIEPSEQSDFCHRMVLFGREYCTAKNPKCNICPIYELCKGDKE